MEILHLILIITGSYVGIFGIVFLINLAKAPYRIHQQQEEKIADLANRLACQQQEIEHTKSVKEENEILKGLISRLEHNTRIYKKGYDENETRAKTDYFEMTNRTMARLENPIYSSIYSSTALPTNQLYNLDSYKDYLEG